MLPTKIPLGTVVINHFQPSCVLRTWSLCFCLFFSMAVTGDHHSAWHIMVKTLLPCENKIQSSYCALWKLCKIRLPCPSFILCSLLHSIHGGLFAVPRTHLSRFPRATCAVFLSETLFSQIAAWWAPLLLSSLGSRDISLKTPFLTTILNTAVVPCPLGLLYRKMFTLT